MSAVLVYSKPDKEEEAWRVYEQLRKHLDRGALLGAPRHSEVYVLDLQLHLDRR